MNLDVHCNSVFRLCVLKPVEYWYEIMQLALRCQNPEVVYGMDVYCIILTA